MAWTILLLSTLTMVNPSPCDSSGAGVETAALVRRTADLFWEPEIRSRIEVAGNALLAKDKLPVTPEAAGGFIEELERCLTVTLFDEARWWFDVHAHAFSPQAQVLMQRFFEVDGVVHVHGDPISAVDPRYASGEPKLRRIWRGRRARSQVEYRTVPGQLFVGPLQVDNVVQGEVGDCYFLAAVDAILVRKPELIERAIHRNVDGTFSTTFFAQKDWKSIPTPVPVTVDDLLPERAGHLLGSHDRQPQELWPAILEKLWAEFRGGYDYASSGVPPDAFMALTGHSPTVLSVFQDSNPDTVFRFLQEHERVGDAMTADTYGKDAEGHPDPSVSYTAAGLVRDHSYSFLGTRMEGAERFVLLRNPWGYREPLGPDGRVKDGVDDGEFRLALSEFIKYFAEVDALPVAGLGPK